MLSRNKIIVYLLGLLLLCYGGCKDDNPGNSDEEITYPGCSKDATSRVDAHTPESVVADWGTPVRVSAPTNTLCPEDAIEISGDGQSLYFLFTPDLLDSMTPAEILALQNNTYRVPRTGGPGEFGAPVYYNLAKGVGGSLDGELSFTPDSTKVYFHSNRAQNLGYNHDPYEDDYLDIYVADIVDGEPSAARNLGEPVNSIYPDGEHAIHPDGVTLYFTSLRPGGKGGADIWRSTLTGTTWSEPVNLGDSINTIADDLQPTFTSDGDTMYFTSTRGLIGAAIYRSVRSGDIWGSPELVIRGICGEPSLTADGQYLYFVHVLSDVDGNYDADIWYCPRNK
jgi:hypothetical protein